MTKTLAKVLPDIVTTLVHNAVLVLVLAVISLFGISASPTDPLTRRIIISVAYLLLIVFTIYVFIAKKQSSLAPAVSLPLFGRWTRVSFVLLALIGIIPVYWSVRPSPSYAMPRLAVRLVNDTATDVAILGRAQFSLQVPLTPVENQDVATGYVQLHQEGEIRVSESLTIPAKGELDVNLEFLGPSEYRPYLEDGNTTMQLIIQRLDGRFIDRQEIPFDQDTLANKYVELHIQQ